MKKKIIGILICTMVFLTSLSFASAISTSENEIYPLDTEIKIVKPNSHVYIFNIQIAPLPGKGRFNSIVIGMIDVEVDIINADINKVEFHVDNELKETVINEPYKWTWNERMTVPPIHKLKVIGYNNETEIGTDEIELLYINPFGFSP